MCKQILPTSTIINIYVIIMIRKRTVTFTLKITTNLDFMYLTVSSLNVSFSKKSIRN